MSNVAAVGVYGGSRENKISHFTQLALARHLPTQKLPLRLKKVKECHTP